MSRMSNGAQLRRSHPDRSSGKRVCAGSNRTRGAPARRTSPKTVDPAKRLSSGGGKGVVAVIEPRHLAQGRCSCGWLGKPRLTTSSAKVDALMHAAQRGCAPAWPLLQREGVIALKPPGILVVDCPAGCGATFPVPVRIGDHVNPGSAVLSGPFTAEAPELPHLVHSHLLHCAAAQAWIRSLMPGTPSAAG